MFVVVQNGCQALFFQRLSLSICVGGLALKQDKRTPSVSQTRPATASIHRSLGVRTNNMFGTVLGYHLVLSVEFISLDFKRNTPAPLRSLL